MPPSAPDPPDPSPGEILARAGWLAVESALLRGLAHDLNGRAAALGGLVELLRLDDDGEDPPVLELLREESARLAESVELLRFLAGDGEEAPPEALALEPLLRAVLALHARHRGLESVETVLEVGDDVPPVWVRRDLLVKVLLTLLGAAGWVARNAGERRMGVGLRRENGRAVVSLGLPGTSAPDGSGSADERPGPDLEAARRGAEEALAADGAIVRRIEAASGGSRLELSLPPLRRRKSRSPVAQ